MAGPPDDDALADLCPHPHGPPFARLQAASAAGAGADSGLPADPLADAPTLSMTGAAAATGTALEPRPGDRVGAWRLQRRLGRGGMGAVYLAERADGHFRQQAALKVVLGAQGPDGIARFARERQILATLQHPDIARLLDGGATAAGQPYLVMEYVEGVPVDRWCREQDLDLAARLALFVRICRSVAFAHQRLIVHCDLKPSNVLVRADGAPVLLDFGIARAIEHEATAAAPGDWFSPRYASPEQLRGEAVTTASDVYALGLILFELLAGRRARLDAGDHTITRLGAAEVCPSSLAAGVPWGARLRGDLDAIVLRATASDPARRYGSVDLLATDIRRHLEHRPVSARARTLPYALGCLVRRRWPLFAAAGLALAVIAGFTVQLAAQRDRAVRAEREARLQAATAERVSDYLVSVFEVSNPRAGQARDISARDVLDQGAARIRSELDAAPAVKARLLDVLGTAYRHIGESRRAAELLADAAAHYQRPDVDQPLAAAAALSQLAVVYSNNARPVEDAERAARQALALREQHAPPGSLAIADSLNTLGVVLEADDRFDEAERLLQQALSIRRELAGTQSMPVATTLHNLGLVARGRGDYAASIARFEEAIAIKRERDGERSPQVQISLQALAATYARAGQAGRAAELHAANLALSRELYGEISDHVALAENEVGSALHDLGRFGDAAAHYRRAIDLYAQLGSSGQAPLNNLASVYEDMGDYAAAEPLFRQSLVQRRQSLAPDSAPVLRAEYNLARLLLRRGDLAESRGLIDHVQAGYLARYGADDTNTAKARLLDVEWQVRRGDFAAAHERQPAIAAAATAADPYLRARAASVVAEIARHGGDAATEIAQRRAALDALAARLGAAHPLVAELAIRLAAAQADAGQAAAAQALVHDHAAIVEQAFAAGAPVRALLARWPSR
ncbi:serine/threonine-protein kinase [Dokdonella koreensis]|uniref:Serine/threonine protein kinase n=1 Tax=Dokdonella koreensis DS-123 TaxID=1300342 RepID=A0A161HJA4_9GAMM|nr:serine/threonine-protein kinase [Dokdonella koreensis]ANB16660.1 Serine/threonine protein kinase [Dokdonella koreensis DS-123]